MTHSFPVRPREGRLDVLVTEQTDGLSRSRAAALIREGRVRVDGRVVTRPSEKVTVAAELVVDVPEPVADVAQPQNLPLSIVYEDEHLAVIDKDAGMVVHPGAGHDDGTLVNALLHHLEGLSGIGGVQRPGIVHRLDKGTSGLMVVAKHDEAHQSLAEQFAAHSAGRVYLALVFGAPGQASGVIESDLARHPTDRMRWASNAHGRGKHAITHWHLMAHAGTVSLVRCELETGRTHQVRVHLSEAGWPLLGDGTYKPRRTPRLPATLQGLIDPSGQRPMLHAWQLHLDHPVDGRPLNFQAAPPPDMAAALEALGIVLPAA